MAQVERPPRPRHEARSKPGGGAPGVAGEVRERPPHARGSPRSPPSARGGRRRSGAGPTLKARWPAQARPVRVEAPPGARPAVRVAVGGRVDGEDPVAGPIATSPSSTSRRRPARPQVHDRRVAEDLLEESREAAPGRRASRRGLRRESEQAIVGGADEERRRLRAALEEELGVVEDVLLVPVGRDLRARCPPEPTDRVVARVGRGAPGRRVEQQRLELAGRRRPPPPARRASSPYVWRQASTASSPGLRPAQRRLVDGLRPEHAAR